MIVVTADSNKISDNPVGSCFPTTLSRSNINSICNPCRFNTIDFGEFKSPVQPAKLSVSSKLTTESSESRQVNCSSLMINFTTSLYFPLAKGTDASIIDLARFITSNPLLGLYLLPFSKPGLSGMMSVPYNASYRLPHLALAAFNAYLGLVMGTTN